MRWPSGWRNAAAPADWLSRRVNRAGALTRLAAGSLRGLDPQHRHLLARLSLAIQGGVDDGLQAQPPGAPDALEQPDLLLDLADGQQERKQRQALEDAQRRQDHVNGPQRAAQLGHAALQPGPDRAFGGSHGAAAELAMGNGPLMGSNGQER